MRVAGVPGMLCAVAGTVIPPLVLLSVISVFYSAFAANSFVALALSGMQAGVAAVLCDVVLSMGKGVLLQKSLLKNMVTIAAFLAVYVFKVNVIAVILCAALVGVLQQLPLCRKGAGV